MKKLLRFLIAHSKLTSGFEIGSFHFSANTLKKIRSVGSMLFAFLLFLSTDILGQSAGFNNTFIVLQLNGGVNTYYDLNAATANTDFNGANLGSFAAGTTNLVFKGAEHNVWKCGSSDLTSTRLFYRIYLTASPGGSYTSNNIGYSSGFNNGCGGQDQVWSNTGFTTNLLSGLSAGAYTIEVYSDATVTNCCGGTVFASNSGSNYKATFTVVSTFYSKAAQTDPNNLTNWTQGTGGTGINPPNFTNDNYTFVVQSGHSYTNTAPWNITGASTLQVDGTLTLSNVLTLGTTGTKIGNLTVNGTVQANVQNVIANTSGVFTINSGGRYVLNHATASNGSTTFNGTETFNTGSTFEYQNLNAIGFVSGVTYHHLTISGAITQTFPASITINGNLTVSNGAITINKDQTVGGNVSVSGGTLTLNSSSSNYTLTVTGSTTVSGTGTLNMATSTGTAAIAGSVFVTGGIFNMTSVAATPGAPTITGNVSVSGGTFNAVAAGAGAVTSTINGSLSVSAGTFNVTGNTAGTAHVVDLNGTLGLSGTGVIEFNPVAAATGAGRMYVSGDVTVSGGTMQRTQTSNTGSTGIYFDAATQTFTWSGGTISTAANAIGRRFYVNGVTTLNETYSSLSGAQTTVNGTEGSPAVGSAWPTSINNLTINNASGVTLSTAKTVGATMTLTAGILTTSATNLLTLTNTSTGAISGSSFSNTKHISGPVRWNIGTGTYVFPVGKSNTYYPFTLAPSASASPVVTVEAFTGNTGGSNGSQVQAGSLSTTEYWQATLNSGTFTGKVSVARQLALGSLNIIAQNTTTLNGAYASIGGTASTPAINNSNDISALGYFVMAIAAPCAAPANQATGVTFSNVGTNGMTISWTRGTPTPGDGVIVVVRSGSAPTTPSDGGTYTASTTFGSGTDVGSGSFVVFNGAGTTVTINAGMNTATNYYVAVYEVNCSGASSKILTTSPATGNQYTLSTEPTAQPASFTASSTSAGQIDLTYSSANSITNAYGYIILQKTGASAPASTPVDGTAYTVGQTFGDATVADIVTDITATTSAITGLASSTQYSYSIYPFSYDGTNSGTYNYRTAATVLTASATTPAAVARYAVATGNWNATSTWSATSGGAPGASVPAGSDVAYIEGGYTVTVTADANCGTINFQAIANNGGTLSVNAGVTLTVSGAVNAVQMNQTVSGSITGAGTVTCASVVVGSGSNSFNAARTTTLTSTIASLTASGTTTLAARDFSGFKNNPTLNIQSGTFTTSGVITTIPSAGGTATLSLATGAQTGTLKISGATPFTIDADGTSTITLNGTGATVEYSGAAQTVRNTSYTNLTLSGSGNKTLAAFAVSGKLSMQGTATAITTAVSSVGTLEYKGSAAQTPSAIEWPASGVINLIIDNTSGVNLPSSFTRTISGTLTFTNGTFDIGANTFTYSGNSITRTNGNIGAATTNATLAFTNTSALSLPASIFAGNVFNMTINGAGGVSLGSGTTVSGTLALTSGTFTVGANTLTLSGSSPTRTSGSVDASNSSATVAFTNGSLITLPGSVFTSGSLNNMTINGAGGVTLGSATTVAGTLALTSGTLTVGANTLTLSGSSPTRSLGAIDASNASATVAFTNSSLITLPVSVFTGTVRNLTINGAGGLQFGASDAITVAGTLQLSSGSLDLNSSTLTLNSGSSAQSVNGNSGNSFSITGSGTISLTGSGAHAVTLTNFGTTPSNGLTLGTSVVLQLNNNATLNAGGDGTSTSMLTVLGTMQINSGTNSNISGSRPPFYGNASTLEYKVTYGVFDEWKSGTAITTPGVPQNVKINGTSQTVTTPSTARNVVGNLDITAGTLALGANSLTIGGNWTNNAAFTHNNQTVIFGGSNPSIGGASANTFYNLTINNAATLGSAATVNNSLNLTGILTLGTNDLTIGSSATISAGSATNYIKTNNTGRLKRTVGTSVAFPIGNSAYNPITVTSSVSDVYAIKVNDAAAGGENNNTKVVNRNWDVTRTGTAATTLTVVPQWNAPGEEATNFVRTSANKFIGLYNSTTWTQKAASLSGSNPYTYSASSISIASGSTTIGQFEVGIEDAFIAGPVVSSVTSNNSANYTGYTGSTITINGSNLTVNAASDVTFGGVAATSITTNTPGQLVVTVGAGASGPISITNTAGQTNTAPSNFTYLGYITQATGDYNTGTTWLGGGVPPASSVVTIDHNGVTVSGASNSATSITINSGDRLEIQNDGSLTATTTTNNGTLTFTGSGSYTSTTVTNNGTLSWTGVGGTGTLNIASGGTLNNAGTFTAGNGTVNFPAAGTLSGTAATLNNLTINTGAVTLSAVPTINGILQMNSTTGSVSAAPVYGTNSTLIYNANYTKGNEWSSTAGTYPGNVTVQGGATLTINPTTNDLNIRTNLTLGVTGSAGSLNMTNTTKGIIVGGDITIGSNTGTSTLTLSSDPASPAIKLGGNWTLTPTFGSFNANGRGVFFTGGNAQTLTGATTFNFLLMAKTANDLTINNDITVTNQILFTNSGTGGKIITNSNTVIMGASASTTGASATSYINGKQSYPIATGTSSRTFDIGDASRQAGVTTSYTGVTAGGTLTAFTTSGDHGQIATSGIYSNNTANRTWTLTNSGIAGGSYNGTFFFATLDLDGSASTSNFVLMRYASSTWNATTTGARTANSTQATGLSAYGEFQAGEPLPQGTITGNTVCAGVTGQLTWTSTVGVGPFSITYYDGTSNQTATGVLSGTPFNVSSGPASTNTYSLVSVTDANGNVRSSGFTGTGQGTVTVIPTVTPVVSIAQSPTGAICAGSSVSFIATPTSNGGLSPTYNFKVGGTSVQNGSSNVYTASNINNGNLITCEMTSNAVCPSPTTVTSNTITAVVNPLPAAYNVTGTGSYCTGGSGVVVGLNNSETGVNYQLKDGVTNVGSPLSGTTGVALDFGNQTLATTYTVVATDATTGCINNMTGNAVVTANPVPATPGLSANFNPICAGDNVTFTATGGSQYGFFKNGILQGSISASNTYATTGLSDADQVTVTSYSPFTFDGNINESGWGAALATSTGGPRVGFGAGPSFGTGHEINALYALSDANNINIALAGSVLWGGTGNKILLFIDSKAGGYNNGNFGRNGAPNGLDLYNSGSTFNSVFLPDYCLAIGTNSSNNTYFFDLYTLSGTAGSGGGPNSYLGTPSSPLLGAVLGASPLSASNTRGFEMAIPKTLLGYSSGTIQVMAMYISYSGFLSNQFLTAADASAGSYGSGAITFGGVNPGSVTIPSVNLSNSCTATSSPATMSVRPILDPSVSISVDNQTICSGGTANFTATPTNPGTSPSYQWKVDGSNAGTNSASFSTSALLDGQEVTCVMTSNAICANTLLNPATSNGITMTVNSNLTPSVTIAANPSGAICAGTSVTFTPTPINGGGSPTYQWRKNGSDVATGATYTTTTLANNDVISCVMTSSLACVAAPGTATSNNLTMTVNPLPTVFNVTGGGSYCSGGSGATIGLDGSESGVNYQLKLGVANVGSPVTGTGSSINFPAQTTNGSTYNVVATDGNGCTSNMTGNATVYTNLVPSTPFISPSQNPICSGTPVTFTATGGSMFEFLLNGNSTGPKSRTTTYVNSTLVNNDNVSVKSYSSILFDGNITEPLWGSPLATSSGGPTPSFGAGHELNAIYAQGDADNLNFAIAGNVQSGNRILLFIDSKTGGFNNGSFNKTNAPPGVNNFNSGTSFDAGFSPDYCLVIGVNGGSDNFFDLFTLASTSGAGTNAYLGGRTIWNFGTVLGGNPANSSQTRGFEMSIPKSMLGYIGGDIQVMAMYTAENGFISNQFLTRALVSENSYGNGALSFGAAAPNPITVSSYPLNNTCTATSTSITMNVAAQPVSGTLTKDAGVNVAALCEGIDVSATAAAGTGGLATISDILQYRISGGSWQNYTSAAAIATTGASTVDIQTYRTSTVAGCNSSTPTVVSWTINPLPTVYTVTGGVCVPVAVGLAGSQNGANYQYQLVRDGVTNVGSPLIGTGNALTFPTQTTTGVYTVVATNTSTGCSSNMDGAFTVNVCTVTWVGTSADWFENSNWNPAAVPNNCGANVVIPSGTNFSPTISSAAVTVGNISLASGVTLTLQGQNLNVCGNWTGGTGSNAAVVGNGTVLMNSSLGAQVIADKTQFNILQISNADGVSLNSGAAVSINTGLHLQLGQLTIGSGSLRLLSTSASHAAYLDDFTPGYVGSIIGNIFADRYVPTPGRNQHFISSPVNNAPLSQLGASGPNGSYVTPTANCDETQSSQGSPYGTVFEYDDTHMGAGGCKLGNWKIRSAGTMENAKGYSAYLTGNAIQTLSGVPNTGDMSVAVKNSGNGTVNTLQGQPIEAGWNLVGNPYPSTISLSISRTGSGFSNQVQVWQTSGPFAGTWQQKVIGQDPDIDIAPFQGFMIRRTGAGNSAYPLFQSERTRATNTRFYSNSADNTLKLELNYNGGKDQTTISFNADATNGFDDAFDANKPGSVPGRATLYTHMNTNMWYGINTIPSLTETATVPMGLRPDVNGTMTITAQGLSTFDPTTYIFLEDKKTGVWHNLRNGAYAFTTTKTDNQDRFVLHFTPAAKILVTDASCSGSGMIEITQPGSANWNYTVTDQNNTTISSGTLNSANGIIINANAGIYHLTLKDNNGYTVMKNIEVKGTQPIVSNFIPSTTAAEVSEEINFTATTSNAVSYHWDFGDGTTGNTKEVVHHYQSEGIYQVNLTVSNAAGCMSNNTQQVSITSRSVTSLPNMLTPKPISIWSERDRVYVDFTQQKRVEAEIELYNVLGQMISREKFGNSTVYSKQLNNLEAAYIIVRVKNDEAVTTKKVYIVNR